MLDRRASGGCTTLSTGAAYPESGGGDKDD